MRRSSREMSRWYHFEAPEAPWLIAGASAGNFRAPGPSNDRTTSQLEGNHDGDKMARGGVGGNTDDGRLGGEGGQRQAGRARPGSAGQEQQRVYSRPL